MAAGTLAGIVVTLAAGSEPGLLLGFFITLGAVIGVLGVRRGAVYLFFPLPPFAFFVGGLITGKVHDSSISSTTIGLFASLLQWIADIFFPMCVATILVLLIGGIRWGLGLMLVAGQFPMSDDRPAPPRGPRPRIAPGPRTDIDPWADPNPGPAARPPPTTRGQPTAGPPGGRAAPRWVPTVLAPPPRPAPPPRRRPARHPRPAAPPRPPRPAPRPRPARRP